MGSYEEMMAQLSSMAANSVNANDNDYNSMQQSVASDYIEKFINSNKQGEGVRDDAYYSLCGAVENSKLDQKSLMMILNDYGTDERLRTGVMSQLSQLGYDSFEDDFDDL